jgi:hypothetical protein
LLPIVYTPPKKSLMQPSSWLDFAWCFSFTRKNCYFISIIHLTVTGKKKKCRLWLDSLSFFIFPNVYCTWMNQPASGPAANGGGRCCGLGMYPRWWLPLNNIFHDYFSFSLPFLYTYPETARLYEKGGVCFVCLFWSTGKRMMERNGLYIVGRKKRKNGRPLYEPSQVEQGQSYACTVRALICLYTILLHLFQLAIAVCSTFFVFVSNEFKFLE